MAMDVRKVIQELVVPELRELKAEIKTVHTEIKRLDEKIDSYRQESQTEFRRLDEKLDSHRQESQTDSASLRNEMRSEFKRLDEKIDLSLQIRERLVALEAKMSAYESRN